MRLNLFHAAAFLAALICLVLSASPSLAGTYYIAPNGNDSSGDGSLAKPWLSIAHATGAIPDNGSTVLLEDGNYTGQSLGRYFNTPITVAAQHPYKAVITASATGRGFYCYGGGNVTFSGLNIQGSATTNAEYVIHLGASTVSNITFQNNIIHDCYNNDLVKVNSGSNNILFKGNLLYNQAPGAGFELFDINTVQNVTVQGNIMLADYAGSGRTDAMSTQSFIVVKNSGYATSPNYTQNCNVVGNIFENWSGRSDQSYVLYGEDGEASWEAQNCKVENNLFLHNNTTATWGAVTLKGGLKGITVRANTTSGNPGGSAPGFGAILQQIGSNPPMQNIDFSNNIWTDQSGKMVGFSNSNSGQVVAGTLKQNSNLYWDNGKPIPGPGILNPANDAKKVLANPGLPDPAGMTISHWDPTNLQFSSGATTITAEFIRLVHQYGTLPAGSPAIRA